MTWLARLRAFFEGVDGRVEEAAQRQAHEDLERARRIEEEFIAGHGDGGAFAERDLLPGSRRAHLYGRGR